jgi:hypothetical protein
MSANDDLTALINALSPGRSQPAADSFTAGTAFADPLVALQAQDAQQPAMRGRTTTVDPFAPPPLAADNGFAGAMRQASAITAAQLRDARAAEIRLARETKAAERVAKKNAPGDAQKALDAAIAKDLGVDPKSPEAATKLANSKLRFDPTQDITAIVKSPEWDALPIAEKRVQYRLLTDAKVEEMVARATESLGKPPKKDVVAKWRKQYEDQALANVGKLEARGMLGFANDVWLGMKGQVQDIMLGERAMGAKGAEDLAKIAADKRALKAEQDKGLSALAKDREKAVALQRADMIKENVKAGLPPELTAAQEVKIGLAASTSDFWRNVLGQLPTTLAGTAAALVGTAVLPGVGGAAAGAAFGQEVTAASVAADLVESIDSMSAADLAKSPEYQRLLQSHNGNATLAKAALTQRAVAESEVLARAVGGASGAAEGAIGVGKILRSAAGDAAGAAVTRGVVGKVLARIGLPSAAKGSAVDSINMGLAGVAKGGVVATAKAIGGEAVQEFAEEGGEKVVGNLAQRDVGLDTALTSGVLEAATQGAVLGAGTAGSVKAGTLTLDKATGAIKNQGDVIVVDDGGKPTAARRASTARQSNLAVNPQTGLARLLDFNADPATDPDASARAEAINAQLMMNVAAQDGYSTDVGALAGMAVNEILNGAANDQVRTFSGQPVMGEQVDFLVTPDGHIAPADPSTPGGQAALAISQTANAMVDRIRDSVTAFAGRQRGWEPAPAVTPQQSVTAAAPNPVAPAPQTSTAPSPFVAPQPQGVAPAQHVP